MHYSSVEIESQPLATSHLPAQTGALQFEFPPGMKSFPTLSIIMEWENVQFSESSRVGRVLAALAEQVDGLAASDRRGELAELPVELLILFDSDLTDGVDVAHTICRALAHCASLVVRVEPVPGLAYFEMKNRGAELARGTLVLFLDSDVIPQPGWLAAMLQSLADPRVQVVASRAYVRPDSLYSKTVALTWLFDLPPQTSELRAADRVHANAIGFRRSVLLAHPYPSTPGQSRGAGWDQFQALRAAGITVYEHTGARVEHPPPHGLANYWRRAVQQGNDDHLSLLRHDARKRPGLGRGLARGARGAMRKWTSAMEKLWRHSASVGLSALELPAAIGLASIYYLGYFLGHLRASSPAAPAQAVPLSEDEEPTILAYQPPAPAADLPAAAARRRTA